MGEKRNHQFIYDQVEKEKVYLLLRNQIKKKMNFDYQRIIQCYFGITKYFMVYTFYKL